MWPAGGAAITQQCITTFLPSFHDPITVLYPSLYVPSGVTHTPSHSTLRCSFSSQLVATTVGVVERDICFQLSSGTHQQVASSSCLKPQVGKWLWTTRKRDMIGSSYPNWRWSELSYDCVGLIPARSSVEVVLCLSNDRYYFLCGCFMRLSTLDTDVTVVAAHRAIIKWDYNFIGRRDQVSFSERWMFYGCSILAGSNHLLLLWTGRFGKSHLDGICLA